MAGLTSRWIIALCCCLLSQQFAPVYMARLVKNHLVKSKRSAEEGEDVSQDSALEKRGKWTTFLKWTWKGIRKTVKTADTLSDITSLSVTVLRAIGGCEALGFEGIRANWNRYKELVNEYTRVSDDIDTEILKAYNMRDTANFTYLMHYDVRQEMERLVTEQNYAFEAMDPRFKHAVNNETLKLEKLIKKKKEDGESVSYAEIDEGYKEGLDLALGLALPSLSLAMPYFSKLYKKLKNGVVGRKMDELQDKFNVKFSVGSSSDDTEKLLKGYEELGTKTDSKRLTSRISNMFSRMKTKYKKVETIVRGVKAGFKLLMTAGSAALGVWQTFNDIKQCADTLTNSVDSVKNMEDVVEGSKKLLENATASVERTKEALADIYNVAWDENLLKGLSEVREMVADEDLSKPRPEATEIINSIDSYKAGTLETPDELFELQDNLRKNLRLVAYNTGCFTIKGKFISNVNDICREGKNTYEQAYEDYVGDYEYPEKIQDCKESSGELYITLDKMKEVWNKYVETSRDSDLNKICILNNDQYVTKIKDAIVDGEKDLSKIATSMFLQGSKGIEGEIQAGMKEFPNIDELPLSTKLKEFVCTGVTFGASAEQIMKTLKKKTEKNITKEEVEKAMEECEEKRK